MNFNLAFYDIKKLIKLNKKSFETVRVLDYEKLLFY